MLGYELWLINKLKKLKKANNTEQLAKFKNVHKKIIPAALITSIALVMGLQSYFKKDFDKNYQNTLDYFNKVNKTNAKFSPEVINSNSVGASYSPVSGEIKINKNMVNDPLGRMKMKGLIRHELVHAKQYETIARSKDGIKKINFAHANIIAKTAKNNIIMFKEFENIYNDIDRDKTGKYDNVIIETMDGKVDLKKYITAIHLMLTKQDVTYNDLPIYINAKHYEDVINKQGKLSDEEEIKADEYYHAALAYPRITIFQFLNPFSDYYNNPLEKEAYKENPWYTRII